MLKVSVGHAFLEPVVTLLGRSVGEGLGDHISLGLLLEIVVTDLRGAIQGFLDVAGLDGTETGVVIICPDSCIVVGEKLQPYAPLVPRSASS